MKNLYIFEINVNQYQLSYDDIDKQLYFIWDKLEKYNKYTTDCKLYFMTDESRKKELLQEWHDWYLWNANGVRDIDVDSTNLQSMKELHKNYTKKYDISIFENKHNKLVLKICNTESISRLRYTFTYDNEMNPRKDIACYFEKIIDSMNYLYKHLKGTVLYPTGHCKDVEYGLIEERIPLFTNL